MVKKSCQLPNVIVVDSISFQLPITQLPISGRAAKGAAAFNRPSILVADEFGLILSGVLIVNDGSEQLVNILLFALALLLIQLDPLQLLDQIRLLLDLLLRSIEQLLELFSPLLLVLQVEHICLRVLAKLDLLHDASHLAVTGERKLRKAKINKQEEQHFPCILYNLVAINDYT